jgi:hypothetical protein
MVRTKKPSSRGTPPRLAHVTKGFDRHVANKEYKRLGLCALPLKLLEQYLRNLRFEIMSTNSCLSTFDLCCSSSSPVPSSLSTTQCITENDDVAIIGMSCRTAGANDSPKKLWKFIMDKKVASGQNPSWRWEPWVRRDTRNAKIIAKTISKGYFIEDLEYFDADFFGISPKEAEQMNPHQRLGLEVT